ANPKDGLVKTAKADRPTGSHKLTSVDTKDGKFKIWYPDREMSVSIGKEKFNVTSAHVKNSKAILKKLKKAAEEDNIYSEFKKVMNREPLSDNGRGGDNKIDIYIIPGIKFAGLAECDGGSSSTPCSGFVTINADGVASKGLIAHEIFHIFQNSFKHHDHNDTWWVEATATWAQDYIYPMENSEQPALNAFLPLPERSLDARYDKKNYLFHYGAYIFPFYLTQPGHYESDIIGKIWKGCEKKGCVEAVNDIAKGGYFKKEWKEFTLWNVNRKPAYFYKDKSGYFPEGSPTSVESKYTQNNEMDIKGEKVEYINLEEVGSLSALPFYLSTGFIYDQNEDKKIRRVTIKNLKNYTSKSDKAGIKTIIYPTEGAGGGVFHSGKGYIEDWTDRDSRSFCLDNPKERFYHMYLIFSNGEINNKISPTKIKIESKPYCYTIDQIDSPQTSIDIAGMNPAIATTPSVNSNVIIDSGGNPTGKVDEDAKYSYLTKWRASIDYQEKWDEFQGNYNGITCDWHPGDITYATDIEFDLSSVKKNGDTFDIVNKGSTKIFTYSPFAITCPIVGTMATEPFEYPEDEPIFNKGKISNMTEDKAEIEMVGGILSDTWPYREMEPVKWEIKSSE
ncbi:MAG: hypothetical protein ABII72_01420, partial [Parcubacteria group bacterium]